MLSYLLRRIGLVRKSELDDAQGKIMVLTEQAHIRQSLVSKLRRTAHGLEVLLEERGMSIARHFNAGVRNATLCKHEDPRSLMHVHTLVVPSIRVACSVDMYRCASAVELHDMIRHFWVCEFDNAVRKILEEMHDGRG